MSAVRTGRKRAREFKLGGQRAQQVQQARVNAVAAQFDKLAPDLRTPALAALHSRCKGSEKATLARLYYKEQITAAGARGAEALNKERMMLGMECIRMLWQGAESAEIATALSELLQQFGSGEGTPAMSDQAHGLQLPAATVYPTLSRPATSEGTTTTDPAHSSDASSLGVTIETQTPTGLPQLLLAEALSWHGQSPPAGQAPEVNSIGVGTAASFATTSETHTQTASDASCSSAPPLTSLGSPSSVEVGTSTTSALDGLPGSGWAWGGLDATTQTSQAAMLRPSSSLGGKGSPGESLGIQVMLDHPEELTAPSPQQAPSSARSGRTTDSGTSPLRFNDHAWD